MDIDRRKVLGLTVAGAAALSLSKVQASQTPSGVDTIREDALDYFGQRGFRNLQLDTVLTGMDYNGGLRHDLIHPKPFLRANMGVRTLARVEDIEERSRPGVLAMFHTLGMQTAAAADIAGHFNDVIDFLTNRRGLDPSKMLFVSTDRVRPHLARLNVVTEQNLVERDIEEATKTADGSGLYAPADHPYNPKIWTVGMYYPTGDAQPSPDVAYPPEDFIEIGETAIAPIDGSDDGPVGSVLGLERLAMAEGEPTPDFEETRLNLLRTIEDEAARTGQPLPEGYRMFAAL